MKIKKLSPEVQSSIRTGISISDVTYCISELVQNSLDAKATSIAVRLNLENFTIQVVDNGHGLTREELDLVGQRYMTSKCHSIKDLKRNLSYYGFRGESLASIRDSCAVLMIISKPEGSDQTYSKVFRAGKKSHEAVVSTHNRLCVGTTVVVKDFLHNLPVRRARIQPTIEIECIRHCLVYLSIINYKVSFTLRNDVSKLVILQTEEYSSSGDALNFHCNLKENHDLTSIFSDSCLFKISAHISRETETSGSFQFIYVNGRLIKNKEMYELVNKHLSKSFFMRNIGKDARDKDDKPKEKAYAVFIIHIQCPFSEYEILSDPKKTKVEFKRWDKLEKNLEQVIDKFVLSENTFYDASEQSCNLQQNEEYNLNPSNTACHNDHIIKSNVLCSKSVTRPVFEVDDLGNNTENIAGTSNVEANTCSNSILNSENNKVEEAAHLENSNGILNYIKKSKRVEVEIDQSKLNCQEKENHQLEMKKNQSKKSSLGERLIKENKDENTVIETKEFTSAAKGAEYNKTNTSERLSNKSTLFNQQATQNPEDNEVNKKAHLTQSNEILSNLVRSKTVDKGIGQSELSCREIKNHQHHDNKENQSKKSSNRQKSIEENKDKSRGLKAKKLLTTSAEKGVEYVKSKTTLHNNSVFFNTKPCLHNKSSKNHKMNPKPECSFSFNTLKTVSNQEEKIYFSEHILTESELEITPAKKMCSLSLQENNGGPKPFISVVSPVRISYFLKRNIYSEHILTDSERHFPFKAPKYVCGPLKRKHFTEHILTESKSGVSPTKKRCSSELKKVNQIQKSPVKMTVTLKENNMSEHILTESESNYSGKVMESNHLSLKRKNLSEHILTESESDVSSAMQITSQENNHNQKSILPIISHEFYRDALKSMSVTQNLLNNLVENCTKEKPRKTFEVKLSRTLKKVPNSNSLKLTQKNTLKCLGGRKGYITCNEGTQLIHESENKYSTNLALKSPTHNSRRSKADRLKVSNHDFNKCQRNFNLKPNNASRKLYELCKLKNNWKLFSPEFTKVTASRSYRAILKNKSFTFRPSSKAVGSKPSLQIKYVKTSSANRIDPVNSSPINQEHELNSRHGKSITEQSPHIENVKNPRERNEIKGITRCQSGQLKNVETQTDLQIIKKSGEAENKTMLTTGNQVVGKNQSWLFKNKVSTSPYFFCPSPVLTNSPFKQSNGRVCGPWEIQRYRHLKKVQNCPSSSANNSFMKPNKMVDFSPILTTYNFDPHYPVSHRMNQFTSFSLSLKNDTKQKLNPKDIDLSFINFPPIQMDSKIFSQQIDHGFDSNYHLSDLGPLDHLYHQPVQSVIERKSHESEYEERYPDLQEYNSSNSFPNREHKNLFLSGMFKVTHNSTPEILKLLSKSPNNKSNFGHDRTECGSKSTKCCSLKKISIPHENEKDIVPYETNTDTTPDRNDITKNVSGVTEQNSPAFQETDCKRLTLENGKDSDAYILNTNTITNCNGTAKNASDSKCENVMFENTAYRDVNLASEHNPFIKEKEPEEKSLVKKTNLNREHSDKCNSTNWNKEITLSGEVFYINMLTGMSSFVTPKAEDLERTFALEKRHWFMPKGVSPILNISGNFQNITKHLSETEKNLVENIVKANNSELLNVKWRKSSQCKDTERILKILNETETLGSLPSSSLDFQKSFAFSSQSLSNAQVLGQVDKKFIAAILQPNEKADMILVLFDQHAVDERIRLESLNSGYKKGDGKLETHALNSMLEINLPENETTLIADLLPKISNLGLNLVVQGNKVVVTSVPLCLFNRYTREGENSEWLSNMVTALLRQLLQSAQDGCRVMPSVPPLLSDLISTEACRGSIKFGDVLTLDLCRLLISKLATCEIPFQCAHGRPVLTPLIEVKEVEYEAEPINLKSLSARLQSNPVAKFVTTPRSSGTEHS